MLCQDCDQYEFTQKRGHYMITERCKIGESWEQEGLQGCNLTKTAITRKAKAIQREIEKQQKDVDNKDEK